MANVRVKYLPNVTATGFGYDPVFMSGGKSFGEITAEEKDAMSHRGKALKLMSEELKKIITE